MQLTDQTVTAAGLSCRVCAGGAGVFERDSIVCRRRDSTVAVSRLDRSAIDDEDEQQQTNAALQVGVLVVKCAHPHVRVLGLPNCTDRCAQRAISYPQICDHVSRKDAKT